MTKLRKPFRPTDLDQPTRDDGGPASAMRLRDWLAGQAATDAFRGGDPDIDDLIFARRCYALADAMLAERRKP